MRFLSRIYGLLLTLYPREYRDEFSEELQMVFNLSLNDVMRNGGLEIIVFVMRELFSLPKAIFYEHLRERRKSKMAGKSATRFNFEPGSRGEILAALLPFLLFSMISMVLGFIGRILDIPTWLEGVIAILLLGSFLTVFIVGFTNAVPRWFMPYLGLPLSFINLMIFNGMMDPEWRGFPSLIHAPWIVRQFVHQGLFWIGLIILIILLVMASAFITKFRPFYQRLRDDWTLLAFIVYGTAPFALVLTFDDYQNEELYKILSFIILALGGWFYLRNKTSWKRFWSLFSGLAFSMLIAAIGKAILYAGPWPRPKFFTWQTEFMSTIIMWMWLALVMLIPLVLNFLPHSENASHVT